MYPYHNRGHSQSSGPPGANGSQNYARGPSASRSPEQMRPSVSRSVPRSPSGTINDDPWHHRPGPPEMREIQYQQQQPGGRYGGGAGPGYMERDERDGPGRGPHHPPPPHWQDERNYGPPPPSHHGNSGVAHSSNRQGPPPPMMPSPIEDRPGRGQYGPPSSMHPSHPYSHPASPSHRPRTPPRIARTSGGGGGAGGGGQGGRGAPPSWDPVSQLPMSAPPSLVPRLPPGGPSSNASGGHPLHQQQTSPVLPQLSSRAGSEGRGGHARVPSWGAHSGRESGPRTNSPPHGAGPLPQGGAYRGASMDRYAAPTSESTTAPRISSHVEQSRKRPASESPPSNMGAPPRAFSAQQGSPTQRGDVMSMSSILGPSGSRAAAAAAAAAAGGSASSGALWSESAGVSSTTTANGSAEKRRRLDSANPNASPSKADIAAGGSTNSKAIAISEAAAANLARRKWSGPIAEEAAQQAAAWRAQEQRWGSGTNSRSPKVGMLPLGSGPERNTPPFAALPNLPGRGTSPMLEGHRRQRSDGLQAAIDTRSPLARNAPLRGPSPPPHAAQHSGGSGGRSLPPKQQQQQQSAPSLPSHGPPPPQQQQQQQQQQQMFPSQAPPQAFYRGPSPPPPLHPSQQQPGGHMSHGSHFAGQPPPPGVPPPAQLYGHPGYHAYDVQGNPVEIDVDEVRGGAFAGHGNQPPPPPPHMMQGGGGGMMSAYDEPPRGRTGPAQHHSQNQSNTRREGSAASSVSAGVVKGSAKQALSGGKTGHAHQQHQQQQQHPSALRDRGDGVERDIHRSVTPVMPGPAKGLLPVRVEHGRSNPSSGRPLVASKDFNSGPKVDSEAVWSALKETEDAPHGTLLVQADGAEGLQQELGRPIGRHLGSFVYDARKTPLLPGELLRRNVGATLEVRIAGQHLGVGPTRETENDADGVRHGRWSLGSKALPKSTVNGHAIGAVSSNTTTPDEDSDARAFWNNKAMLQRKAWGTDVYTDDSDVLMMCLHTGWLQGPTTDDVPSWVPPGKAVNVWRRMTDDLAINEGTKTATATTTTTTTTAAEKPADAKERKERLEQTLDISVTLRVAPKLIAYKGSQRGGVKTRSWGNTHDGVSLLVEHICLKPAGYASGERGLRSMKQRIDQLARLKMLAAIAGDAGPMPPYSKASGEEKETVAVVAETTALRQHMAAGGLLDILVAAQLTADADEGTTTKRFWQFDPHVDVIKA